MFSLLTPNWPTVMVTMRQRKVPQTQIYTSRDTSRHGRCDDELTRTCWGLFCRKRHAFCETDICQFQRSFLGPNASSNLVQTPVRPRLSIQTHRRTTKLNGVGVRVGLPKAQSIGSWCSWVDVHHNLGGVSACMQFNIVRPFTKIHYRGKIH